METDMKNNDVGAIRSGYEQQAHARENPNLQWWRDARFGMFIHWGLYAIPAGQWKGEPVPGISEWIMLRARIPVTEYESLAQQFDPTEFDADAWVSLAKRAGQKYLVITAKHHDGFCMFDSNATDYDIVDATPFGRDPMTELARACQDQGIRLCFYYSQTQDWHHPDGHGNDWDFVEAEKDFAGYIERYVKPQVTELLTNYGPIGLIWFDTPLRITSEESRSLVDLVHELQPECLVNGRIGNSLGDYSEARDNAIPDEVVDADWETPATIGESWGFKRNDDELSSASDLIRKLVDTASKNGNYLLNVGPTAEGTIPQSSVDRLEAMGAWLEKNGESVYGTTAGPVQGLAGLRSTRNREAVYLHVFDWPSDGAIAIPRPAEGVLAAWLLSDPKKQLAVSEDDDRLLIQGPTTASDPVDTVIALTVAGNPD